MCCAKVKHACLNMLKYENSEILSCLDTMLCQGCQSVQRCATDLWLCVDSTCHWNFAGGF